MMTITEQEQRMASLEQEFAMIKQYVESAVGHETLHHVEQKLLQQLMALGGSLLKAFIAQSGTGYHADNPPRSSAGKPLTFKGIVDSPYYSIFGEITIARATYSKNANEYVYPLDVQLNLPEQKFSYLLQKWVLARSTETDFREAIELFFDMLGLKLSAAMAQRVCAKVAPTVGPFYEQHPAPAVETEGSHLAISADGKGIRIRKTERSPAELTVQASKPRLGKGEKAGTKKQAVVTVDFSFNPVAREPEEIVKALLKQFTPAERQQAHDDRHQRQQQGLEEPRVALNKHVRATLEGKEPALTYLMERLRKRDPAGEKNIVALLDGDRHLEGALNHALEACQLHDHVAAVILDIIHVSEYVWEVGTALHGEKGAARVEWVREKLLALLRGEVGRVIGGLKQMLTKNELRVSQQTALKKAISYFENHRHMMDYASYLAQGYPIATGLVEGTCGSLVKDRMEQSGMQWSLRGAQAVLDLRAVKKNDDWEALWQFQIQSENHRLYADSYRKAA